MVFRKAPDVFEINGKSIIPDSRKDENLERVGKHLKLSKEQLRQRYAPERRQAALNAVEATHFSNFDQECEANTRTRELEDPFMNIEAIAGMDVYERQRIVHDQGAYVDTWLGEIAVLAKDREWLKGQIEDPRWADHPGRPGAIKRIDEMSAKIAEIADSIAWAEAWADRCWQTLTPEERKPVAHMWLTRPEDGRLVTRAWKDQAHFGWSWPKGFYVEGRWFKGLPDAMYLDLQPLWMNTVTWLGEPIDLPADTNVIDARGLIH